MKAPIATRGVSSTSRFHGMRALPWKVGQEQSDGKRDVR